MTLGDPRVAQRSTARLLQRDCGIHTVALAATISAFDSARAVRCRTRVTQHVDDGVRARRHNLAVMLLRRPGAAGIDSDDHPHHARAFCAGGGPFASPSNPLLAVTAPSSACVAGAAGRHSDCSSRAGSCCWTRSASFDGGMKPQQGLARRHACWRAPARGLHCRGVVGAA